MTNETDHNALAEWSWDAWLRPCAALAQWHRHHRPRAWSRLPDAEHEHLLAVAAAMVRLHTGPTGDPLAAPVSALVPSPATEHALGALDSGITTGLAQWDAVKAALVDDRPRWDSWCSLLHAIVTAHTLAGAVGDDPDTAAVPTVRARLLAIGAA